VYLVALRRTWLEGSRHCIEGSQVAPHIVGHDSGEHSLALPPLIDREIVRPLGERCLERPAALGQFFHLKSEGVDLVRDEPSDDPDLSPCLSRLLPRFALVFPPIKKDLCAAADQRTDGDPE
jgi:hypothetical protein